MVSERASVDPGSPEFPRLLSRDEYAFFRMVLQSDPAFSLMPAVSFSGAFVHAKWYLLVIVASAAAGIFQPALLYLTAVAALLLAVYLFRSPQATLIHYLKRNARRKRYERQLKQVLLRAASYDDYLREVVRL